MNRTRVRTLLLGRDRIRSKRYLALALVLFVGTLATMGGVWALAQADLLPPFDGRVLLWALAAVVVGVPALHAYRNDGLLVCLALGLAAPLAFYLVLTTFALVTPSEDVLWGFGTAALLGLPAGALGFLLGVGGRWLSRQVEHHRRGHAVR